MFAGSRPSQWWTLRWLKSRKSIARRIQLKNREREKSHEETCVDSSFGGAGGCGRRAADQQCKRFDGQCGASTGVERGSEDRQLQLWPGDTDGGGGNYGDVDEPRRHSAYRGQRR